MQPLYMHALLVRGTMCSFELLLILDAHMKYSTWYGLHEGEDGYYMGTETAKWHDYEAGQACSLLTRRGVDITDRVLFKAANSGDLTPEQITLLERECRIATHFQTS